MGRRDLRPAVTVEERGWRERRVCLSPPVSWRVRVGAAPPGSVSHRLLTWRLHFAIISLVSHVSSTPRRAARSSREPRRAEPCQRRELAELGMALTRGRLSTVNTVINGGSRRFSKPAELGMALTRSRLSTVNTVFNGGYRLFSKPAELGMALTRGRLSTVNTVINGVERVAGRIGSAQRLGAHCGPPPSGSAPEGRISPSARGPGQLKAAPQNQFARFYELVASAARPVNVGSRMAWRRRCPTRRRLRRV